MTKKYKIYIHQKVDSDFEKIFTYISRDDIFVAQDILLGLRESIRLLEIFPERFAIIPEEINMRQRLVRHYIYKKTFRIIYAVFDDYVEILEIRHGSLEPLSIISNNEKT